MSFNSFYILPCGIAILSGDKSVVCLWLLGTSKWNDLQDPERTDYSEITYPSCERVDDEADESYVSDPIGIYVKVLYRTIRDTRRNYCTEIKLIKREIAVSNRLRVSKGKDDELIFIENNDNKQRIG